MSGVQTSTVEYPFAWLEPGWEVRPRDNEGKHETSVHLASVRASFSKNSIPVCQCVTGFIRAPARSVLRSDAKVTIFYKDAAPGSREVAKPVFRGRISSVSYSKSGNFLGVALIIKGVAGDLDAVSAYIPAISSAGMSILRALHIQYPGLPETDAGHANFEVGEDLVDSIKKVIEAISGELNTQVSEKSAKVIRALDEYTASVPTDINITVDEILKKITGSLKFRGLPDTAKSYLETMFLGSFAKDVLGTTAWAALLRLSRVFSFAIAPTFDGVYLYPDGCINSALVDRSLVVSGFRPVPNSSIIDLRVRDVGMLASIRGVVGVVPHDLTPHGESAGMVYIGAFLNRPGRVLFTSVPSYILCEKAPELVDEDYGIWVSRGEEESPVEADEEEPPKEDTAPAARMELWELFGTRKTYDRMYHVVTPAAAGKLIEESGVSGYIGASVTGSDDSLQARFMKNLLAKVLFQGRLLECTCNLDFSYSIGQPVALQLLDSDGKEGRDAAALFAEIQGVEVSFSSTDGTARTRLLLENVRSLAEDNEISDLFSGHPLYDDVKEFKPVMVS